MFLCFMFCGLFCVSFCEECEVRFFNLWMFQHLSLEVLSSVVFLLCCFLGVLWFCVLCLVLWSILHQFYEECEVRFFNLWMSQHLSLKVLFSVVLLLLLCQRSVACIYVALVSGLLFILLPLPSSWLLQLYSKSWSQVASKFYSSSVLCWLFCIFFSSV